MARIRTFIAIELLDHVRDAISQLIEQLRATRADVRWVLPQNLHLTLKFLGDIDERQVEDVTQGTREASSGVGPFELQFSGVGAFPNWNHPRVIWLGLHRGVESLQELAGRIETSLEAEGFEKEKREFSPHLTIGRVTSPKELQSLVVSVGRMSFVGPAMVVDRITVLKSDLRPTGPIYTRLAAVQLLSPLQ